MKKKISADDCKKMFNDRFDSLTMKELGIELKHFSMGTAPETPSFLVNQEELKQKIIERFSVFFDKNKAQGLEIIFLKSNYGNGKSHFIRMIYSFFEEYENIIARKVSLKQEKTDLKRKVLESVSQRMLKDCADLFVGIAEKDALSDNKASIIFALQEKYSIGSALALILYEAARGEDVVSQIQAVSILKGNYLPEHLKKFNFRKSDLDGQFYYDVIEMVAEYLKWINNYLIIVFDEYEHVFSWKNKTDRKNLFEDIKLFTDNIETFGNMFFVFAESISADKKSESSDDPAFKSRKANLTYQIADISSREEVYSLFEMILKRYEKYYEISFGENKKAMFYAICSAPEIKEKTNYRAYTQVIMQVLEQYRKKMSDKKEEKERRVTRLTSNSIKKHMAWKNATSISRKTMLCEMSEKVMEISKENIISRSKKRGEYVTNKDNTMKRYHIVATDNPSKKDLEKRLRLLEENLKEEKGYLIYPAPSIGQIGKLTEEKEKIKIIIYQDATVCNAISLIYGNEDIKCDMDGYLEMLNSRRANADN